MKTFFDYLAESNKIYQFKIAIAGNAKDGLTETLKTVLEKFGVEKMTAGKSTPIQETPLEFPQLKNMDITHYELEVRYPVTAPMIEEHIAHSCNIPRQYVHVRSAQDPINVSYEEPAPKSETYKALLDTFEFGGESAQNMAGQNRVMDLLKELELARKENPYDATASIKNNTKS
jgi:hypothetical protein